MFRLLALHALVLFQVSVVLTCAHRFTYETDKQALLEFKSQVSERERVVFASWNNSSPLCEWIGVTCGRKHRRVTGLDLEGLKLTGLISPSIGNLSYLRSLNLADNFFHGTIPREVGKLFRLRYLNMSNNILGGEIPLPLSNCSTLSSLDLSLNNLDHSVPSELGLLPKLALLSLRRNNLTGELPVAFGNLTSLRKLDLEYNLLEGGIPNSLSRLTQITFLRIAANGFSGVFPPAIYNLSSLEFLSFPANNFFGNLRPDLDTLFPNLQVLFLGGNRFVGTIPPTLSNISSLRQLDIASNGLRGSIPASFGKLQNLQVLGLSYNYLGSYSSGDLDFLGALVNCTQLEYLGVSYNRLGGMMPTSIANLSTKLTSLFLGGNLISGSIPLDIGNLVSLRTLKLEQNVLTGGFPSSFGKLSGLERLFLQSNELSGEIPPFFGNFTRLTYLYPFNNSFRGSIPPSLGNCSYLLYLGLGSNELSGAIPQELMYIPSLVYLEASRNSLSGPLSNDFGNSEHLVILDVSYNKFSGHISETIGSCLALEELRLQGNFFDGAVPDIRGLINLEFLDLSNNNLSGPIPMYMGNFSSIQYLNLSVNNLQGAVPISGGFQNASAVSIFGNKNLCGGIPALHLNPCFEQVPRKHSSTRKKLVIGLGVASLLLSLLIVISLCWFRERKRKHRASSTIDVCDSPSFYERISYGVLHNATGGFHPSNLIGSSDFGDVFKAVLGPENRVVAVKVLNLRKHGAAKSFMKECEALRGVRHRNLVKLVTACSSIDFKGNEFRALVYEYMPNGSLETWLHPKEQRGTSNRSRSLTLLERLNISIDVASALVYLHAYSRDPIAHCDLKPSNVLLDDDLVAHVSDFGLAQILLKLDREAFLSQLSSAGIRGTIGYAAPEYGTGGEPSIMSDVYSFGILVLEIFTGKRPTDKLFEDGHTLHSHTELALPERVLQVADQSIIQNTDSRNGNVIAECLALVLQVGIRCSQESPTSRITMVEASKELISIRERFFRTRSTARL